MKSKAPLMSLNPSGSFAKLLVASKNRGRNYLSITHKPGGRPSPAQVNRRSQFLLARDAWLLLTDEEKAEYNLRAKLMPLTGYNLFIKEFKGQDMPLLSKKISISSAQILDLFLNPVELLPALPANQFYVLHSFVSAFFLNVLPYIYTGQSVGITPSSNLGSYFADYNFIGLLTNSDTDFVVQPITANGVEARPGDGIVFSSQDGPIAGGDSSLDITLVYTIETNPFL